MFIGEIFSKTKSKPENQLIWNKSIIEIVKRINIRQILLFLMSILPKYIWPNFYFTELSFVLKMFYLNY